MVSAAERELAEAGVEERPEVVLADAGYWSNDHIDRLRERGITPIVAADADRARGRERHASAGPTTSCAGCSPPRRRRALLTSPGDGRARLRRHQAEPARRAVQTQGPGGRPLGMAPDRRHSQPPEAPPTHPGGRDGLIRGRTAPAVFRSRRFHRRGPVPVRFTRQPHARGGASGRLGFAVGLGIGRPDRHAAAAERLASGSLSGARMAARAGGENES